MIISRMVVELEPEVYANRASRYYLLKVTITNHLGEKHYSRETFPQNDLKSMLKILLNRAEEELTRYLLEKEGKS